MDAPARSPTRSDIRTRRVHSDYGRAILPTAARSERETSRDAAVCDVQLAQAVLGGGALDGPHSHDNPIMRRVSMCSCSGTAGTVTLTVAPTDRAGRWADPTAAFPLALASHARWVVRAVAMPADGHEVDQAALQQLADGALASLPA